MSFVKSKNFTQYLIIFIIFCIILAITISPQVYMKSTFNGIMIWANVVLPSLLPFFFFTKILSNMQGLYRISNIFKTPMQKLYTCPPCASYITLMSFISGYPVGAKLTSEFYKNNIITKSEAHRIISFCSTSGPLFIIGSVGTGLYLNQTLGLIIFFSHIFSSLLNGLIYRKYKLEKNQNKFVLPQKSNNNILNDSMYNTISSVMIVGGFIAISFVVIDILNNLNLLYPINTTLNYILSPIDSNLGSCVVNGILEITRGCVNLSKMGISSYALCIISTGLISFGGISVHLQSLVFLSECDIKYRYFLLTKITHAILSMCICAILFLIV